MYYVCFFVQRWLKHTYPVSFLMNSGQYCEDLDEAFQDDACLCWLCLFALQPAHIYSCHIWRTEVTLSINSCFALFSCFESCRCDTTTLRVQQQSGV